MTTTQQRRPRSRAAAVVCVVLTMVCAAVILRKAFDAAGTDALAWWSLALAATWAVGGGVALALTGRGAPSESSFGHAGLLARHPFAVSLTIGCVIAGACFVGGAILIAIPWTEEWIRSALTAAESGSQVVVVAVALVAGAAEEIFFRGALPGLMRGILRWVVPLALYTLVTLASGNLALTLCAPVLGAAAMLARDLTERLWAAILVHACWTVAMVWLFPVVFRA